MKSKTTDTLLHIVDALLHKKFKYHGIPSVCVESDHDRKFYLQFRRRITSRSGTQLNLSESRHPWTYGASATIEIIVEDI